MIGITQIQGFADELVKIANLPVSKPVETKPQQIGISDIKSKSPPKGGILSSKTPTYSKVQSAPSPSPMAGFQSTMGPPEVRS